MKKKIKAPKKTSGLEEKVDFIINFLQTQVPTKDEFNDLTKRVADVKTDVHGLITAVDKVAKMIKDYHQEMVILVHRVERMEMWIKKASVKLGIPYEF